jgi:hypothetical protein
MTRAGSADFPTHGGRAGRLSEECNGEFGQARTSNARDGLRAAPHKSTQSSKRRWLMQSSRVSRYSRYTRRVLRMPVCMASVLIRAASKPGTQTREKGSRTYACRRPSPSGAGELERIGRVQIGHVHGDYGHATLEHHGVGTPLFCAAGRAGRVRPLLSFFRPAFSCRRISHSVRYRPCSSERWWSRFAPGLRITDLGALYRHCLVRLLSMSVRDLGGNGAMAGTGVEPVTSAFSVPRSTN